jgi:hypothetical protein
MQVCGQYARVCERHPGGAAQGERACVTLRNPWPLRGCVVRALACFDCIAARRLVSCSGGDSRETRRLLCARGTSRAAMAVPQSEMYPGRWMLGRARVQAVPMAGQLQQREHEFGGLAGHADNEAWRFTHVAVQTRARLRASWRTRSACRWYSPATPSAATSSTRSSARARSPRSRSRRAPACALGLALP